MRIMKELYADSKAHIKQGNKLSQLICPRKMYGWVADLFSLLFLTSWKECWGNGRKVIYENFHWCVFYILIFADDQMMFAQDAFDIKFIFKRLSKHYHNWELTINISKTGYLAVNSKSFQISISNKEMGQIHHSRYLDIWITKEKGIEMREIKNGIEQVRNVIGCLNLIWWDRSISR